MRQTGRWSCTPTSAQALLAAAEVATGVQQSEPSYLLPRAEQIKKQLKDRGDIPAKLSWSAP